VAERVRVREIDDDEGRRLLRIIRRAPGRWWPGGRPATFTLPEQREVKKIARSKPAEHGLPFSTWTAPTTAATKSKAAWSAATSSGETATPTTPAYVRSSPEPAWL